MKNELIKMIRFYDEKKKKKSLSHLLQLNDCKTVVTRAKRLIDRIESIALH